MFRADAPEKYKYFCAKLLNMLLSEILIPELTREIKAELFESAEEFVIRQAQEAYEHMLMEGPFSNQEGRLQSDLPTPGSMTQGGPAFGQTRGGLRKATSASGGVEGDYNIIPDRPRCAVMSVIINQIDNGQCVCTLAVVDKYGELVASLNLSKLMPPRKIKDRQGEMTEEEKRRQNKQEMQIAD